MAILFRDDFTDPNGTQLDVHVPAPIAPVGAVWEYIEAGAAPYAINSNAVRDEGIGIANPARVSAILPDDLIVSTGIFSRSVQLTLVQTGQLHICVEEGAIKASPERIQAEINGTQGLIIFLVDATGLPSRDSGGSGALSRDLTIPFEMSITKIGTSLEMWAQDIGGGNRVSESMTLTAPEQALYEDGAHRMTGISCTGTQAGHYVCDSVQVADAIVPIQKQTVIDFENTQAIAVQKQAIVDYEISFGAVALFEQTVVDYESVLDVTVARQAIVDYESTVFSVFCPIDPPDTITPVMETAAAITVSDDVPNSIPSVICPTPRVIRCV